MTLCAKFRKCEILLKLEGISSKVKNKHNEYIHPNWNDKRNIVFKKKYRLEWNKCSELISKGQII